MPSTVLNAQCLLIHLTFNIVPYVVFIIILPCNDGQGVKQFDDVHIARKGERHIFVQA